MTWKEHDFLQDMFQLIYITEIDTIIITTKDNYLTLT